MSIPSERLQNRINELKAEMTAGEQQMQALEQRKKDLESTMLRIKGAIQVLEEMLSAQNSL
jgi:hypothetical protein